MLEQKSENRGEGLSKFRTTLLLSILAGLAIFVGLSIYADIREVIQALAEFKWHYIALILGLVLTNYLLRFGKWDFYLRNIGIKLQVRHSLAIFLSGLTMAITPAKLGEVLKAYLLKRLNDTAVSRSVSVVIAERITDGLGLLILAAVSFPAFEHGNKGLLVVPAVLLVLMITIIRSRSVSNKLIEISKSIPGINKISSSIRTSYETAHTLFD